MGLTETLPEFQSAFKEVTVDESAVREVIKQDKASEVQQRMAARRGTKA